MKNEMNEMLKKSLEAHPASPFLNGLVGAMDPSEREAFERFRATQKSTRPHGTKPNEMNLDQIPTPETNAFMLEYNRAIAAQKTRPSMADKALNLTALNP